MRAGAIEQPIAQRRHKPEIAGMSDEVDSRDTERTNHAFGVVRRNIVKDDDLLFQAGDLL